MHCEQSSVGNVLSRRDIMPPMDGSFSTKYVLIPASASSSEAWIPAMPAPITSAAFSTGTVFGVRGSSFDARATSILTKSFAFSMAFSGSSMCTHVSCSRMLDIVNKNEFTPPSSVAFLKVGSWSLAAHAATTVRDVRQGLCILNQFLNVYAARAIGSAVTYENADSHLFVHFLCLLPH